MGARTRQWMKEYWDPKTLLERFWLPALQAARSISSGPPAKKHVTMRGGMPQVTRQHQAIHKKAVLRQRSNRRKAAPVVEGPNVHAASELKGRLKGKPCIIFGNSVSLNLMDMEKMRAFATVGCNRILRLFEPDYYICVDRGPYSQDIELIENYNGARVLSSTIYSDSVVKRVPLQPMPSFDFYTFRFGGSDSVQTDWSQPISGASNISWPMFQLAVMLGANPIGIAGIDFDWPSDKESHFFGAGGKVGAFPVNTPRLQRVFQNAARWCHKHRVKVFNLSPEGALNAFERTTEVEFHRRFEEYAVGARVCPRELLELESDPCAAAVQPVPDARHQPGSANASPGRNAHPVGQRRAARGASAHSAREAEAAALRQARGRVDGKGRGERH